MSRRVYSIAAAVLVVAPFLYAADAKNERTRLREETRRPKLTLAALSARLANRASVPLIDGESSGRAPMQIIVVRTDGNGSPSVGCISESEAAKRFLQPERVKLPATDAEEH